MIVDPEEAAMEMRIKGFDAAVREVVALRARVAELEKELESKEAVINWKSKIVEECCRGEETLRERAESAEARVAELEQEKKQLYEDNGQDYLVRAERNSLRKQLAAAQSRILALEGALTKAVDVVRPFVTCNCRSLSYGMDSRTVGQEHWGSCLLRIHNEILAILSAALAPQPQASGGIKEEKDATR